MASPQNDIEWAEGAAASDLAFPTVEQVSGYQFDEDYPNAQLNQYRRDTARWVARGFADLAEFIDVVPPGGIGAVSSFDPSRQFGDVLTSGIALEAECHAMDTDGRFVFTLEGDTAAPNRELRAYRRDDLSTVLASITPVRGINDNNEYLEVVCNGAWVAVAINDSASGDPLDGWVELFAWDPLAMTLTRQWLWHDNSGFGIRVTDISMDHEAVYIAQDGVSAVDGGAGYRVLFSAATGGATITNGSEDWISAHGAALNAVDTNGFHVVFGGLDDGGQTWRVTNFQNSPLSSGGSNNIEERQISVLSGRWFRVEDDGGVRRYRVRGVGALSTASDVEVFAAAAAPTTGLTVDDRYIISGFSTGQFAIIDTALGFTIETVTLTTAHAAVTDGDAFFLGGEAADAQFSRRYRASRTRHWRRVEATDQNLPFRQLAIPEVD